ncbi:MAG: Crp/Fnr family transcriptional regulator [Zoogloea sp.]|nr:MAG: Crp/Fnr family transcriptional regulator [Zoogloea sp.]
MPDLADFSPFRDLPPEGRRLLERGATSRHVPSTTPLLHKGQKASGAYFVLEGHLRVYALAPNGTEATLYTIAPGETCVFALNSLFNDLLYPAWVQAVEPTTLAVLPAATYRQLFAEQPLIRDFTVRTLSSLVFHLMGQLEEVHAYTLRQRLANLLLTHAASSGELRMTQQQMGFHLGTTREVVARLLGEWVDAGLIHTRRGATRLLDPAALSRLLDGSAPSAD